jgi:hypothetical protein
MPKPPVMTSIVTARTPKRNPRKKPAKPEPVKTIVTAKRPRRRHYGEIIDDVADPPDAKSRPNAPGRSSNVG